MNERGVTLVELLVALALVSIAVIPFLEIFPVTLAGGRTTDVGLRLDGAAVRKTEELISRLRNNENPASGSEACTDMPNCRLEWTVATELSSGVTGVGWLRTVAVTACQDSNGNASCESGEEQVRFNTKVTSRP